jgi:hypothetical protein
MEELKRAYKLEDLPIHFGDIRCHIYLIESDISRGDGDKNVCLSNKVKRLVPFNLEASKKNNFKVNKLC